MPVLFAVQAHLLWRSCSAGLQSMVDQAHGVSRIPGIPSSRLHNLSNLNFEIQGRPSHSAVAAPSTGPGLAWHRSISMFSPRQVHCQRLFQARACWDIVAALAQRSWSSGLRCSRRHCSIMHEETTESARSLSQQGRTMLRCLGALLGSQRSTCSSVQARA